jgi:hypothetical protein
LFKKLSSIAFVLALTATGWSNVLAAARCPHQGCVTLTTAEERPVTDESDASMEEHCSEGMEPSEHRSHEATVVSKAESPAGTFLQRVDRHSQFCTHCMGAPPAPASSSFGAAPNQARRDAEMVAPRVVRAQVLPGVATFPALRPTQGSPPAPVQRRHLLIHVFLI